MEMLTNTGNVLQMVQIIAIVGGGFFFLYQIKAQIMLIVQMQEQFTTRLSALEDDIKKLSEVTVEIARQDERMTAQDTRLNSLSSRFDDFLKIKIIPAA